MLISLEDSFREHEAELSATRYEQTLHRGFTSLGLDFCFDRCFNGYKTSREAILQCTASVSNLLICTYLLTPWSRVLLEKLTGLQLVKKFSTFYGTRMLITTFTSVRHLSQLNPVYAPTSHFLKIRLNIILPSMPGSPHWSLSPDRPARNQSLYRLSYPAHPLSLSSTLNVSDQVSHLYKTTSKIIILYIFIFKFLDSKLEDKRFCTE
jgi:hypothetical protein